MFKRKTTLVVGAGCSAEYGLPIGDGLKNEIADQLGEIGKSSRQPEGLFINSRGADEVLVDALTYARQRNTLPRLDLLANSMAPGIRQASSIDRYLHLHRDDEAKVLIGKLAIARAILAAEQNSHLDSEGFDLPEIARKREWEPHWLQQLFFRLQDDVSLGSLRSLFDNLTIITFNYDRVIEHYLFHAVRTLAGIDEKAAADVLAGLKIIHPYGKIGRLPWQPSDGSQGLPFGHHHHLSYETIIQAGERLRTFTETVEDPDLLGSIKGAINTADQIVFLGFSFLPQNLELMKAESRSSAESVYATSFRESGSNLRIARTHIKQMLAGTMTPHNGGHNVEFIDLPAGRYFHEYGNELAG